MPYWNMLPLASIPYYLSLQQRAEDLGFDWAKEIYPTPIWAVITHELHYNKPLFDIDMYVWNRELRLWAADCVEPALRNLNVKDEYDVCCEAVNIAKGYANDTAHTSDLILMAEITEKLARNPILDKPSEEKRYYTLWAVNYLTRCGDFRLRGTAHYAYRYAALARRTDNITLEDLFISTKLTLFKHIDLIAPWANSTTNTKENTP